MTQRADLFHEVPVETAMRAPRVPAFDASDLPPISGVTDSSRETQALRFDVEGMGACLLVVADGVIFVFILQAAT